MGFGKACRRAAGIYLGELGIHLSERGIILPEQGQTRGTKGLGNESGGLGLELPNPRITLRNCCGRSSVPVNRKKRVVDE
jgi:hypothetical protein